jgi:hypothetical protein
MHAGGNGTWYGQMGEDARKKIEDFVIINRMDISRGNGKEISVVLTVLESYGIVSPCNSKVSQSCASLGFCPEYRL